MNRQNPILPLKEAKLYSALYIGIMLAVDLLYGVLDPRIRVSASGEGDA